MRTKVIEEEYHRDAPKYWLGFWNGKFSGQVVLSTIRKIEQPSSKMLTKVTELPFVTDEFSERLKESEKQMIYLVARLPNHLKTGSIYQCNVSTNESISTVESFKVRYDRISWAVP